LSISQSVFLTLEGHLIYIVIIQIFFQLFNFFSNLFKIHYYKAWNYWSLKDKDCYQIRLWFFPQSCDCHDILIFKLQAEKFPRARNSPILLRRHRFSGLYFKSKSTSRFFCAPFYSIRVSQYLLFLYFSFFVDSFLTRCHALSLKSQIVTL